MEKENNVLILNTSMGTRVFSLCPLWTLVTQRSQFLQSAPWRGCVWVLGDRPSHHFAGRDTESPLAGQGRRIVSFLVVVPQIPAGDSIGGVLRRTVAVFPFVINKLGGDGLRMKILCLSSNFIR